MAVFGRKLRLWMPRGKGCGRCVMRSNVPRRFSALNHGMCTMKS